MSKTKLFASILLALAVLIAQVGSVAAAPQMQDTTPITGTIESIKTEPDANGITTVLVTFEDGQSVRISVKTAVDLLLVDPVTHEVDETKVGSTLEIASGDVIADEESAESDVHPISSILADFFFKDDPDMASVIDSFHNGDNEAEQVFGFGVIAQALWMSKSLNDGTADADLAAQILAAKQSGNYSEIKLPDGFEWPDDTAPTNWGQFKKAIKAQNENKDKQNLGSIVSDQADDGAEDPTVQQDQGNGKNKKDKDKDKGKDKGKGKGQNKP